MLIVITLSFSSKCSDDVLLFAGFVAANGRKHGNRQMDTRTQLSNQCRKFKFPLCLLLLIVTSTIFGIHPHTFFSTIH
jgi:hypothetical protein